ncbi:MAG: response regulator transcription factor [Chitinophagaceae bacterium]|nr:MAG: response regulator transcription factor [Chitinophagaceae bacterium]
MTTDSTSKRFLIADDHPLIRLALTTLIEQTYPESSLEQLESGENIPKLISASGYDLLIMDFQMPDTDVLWLIKYLSENHPDLPVLIYSMCSEKLYGLRILQAGAKGFVSKSSPLSELKKAIVLALEKKVYLSQELAQQIAGQRFQKSESPVDKLSPRELQIATLLLEGHSLSKIAAKLHIQQSTAGTHKAKIFTKLKVANLIELNEVFKGINNPGA